MATPFPFVAGAVLEAAELNAITELPINDQTASYVLVAGDAGKRVIMNAAGATTITVNNSLFVAGQMVFIANKGAGTCTVTAGAGVTVNVNGSLAVTQYGGGTLLALSASSFVFFPGSVKNTLSVEYLLVGGGGGGGSYGQNAISTGGGGGAGGFVTGSGIIGKTTYTIKVGAGGAGASTNFRTAGENGTASSFISSANGGGGGGPAAGNGASGGGAVANGTVGGSVSGEGNNGGTGIVSPPAFSGSGGGGGAGGVGGNGTANTGGAGGAASTNNYTGSSISYSGGGGGGGYTTGGTAGTNAGNGGSNAAGSNATANRGGGGGGSGDSTGSLVPGGNGGSGRVVVRWLTADAAGLSISTTGSPTTGTDGSYTWYAWDSTGTLVVA